jgi:RNA polymerase sigma factor (TIGR02999 family)
MRGHKQPEMQSPVAGEELLATLYTELRKLAAAKMKMEQPGQTLQPTALVHEAWLRMGKGGFANRAQFFAAAAEAMRRILIDRARRKQRDKRGAGAEHIDLDGIDLPERLDNQEEAFAVHEALDRLGAVDARKADIVKLRYFVGCTFEQIAKALGISIGTAKREWAYARAWLHSEIGKSRETNRKGMTH